MTTAAPRAALLRPWVNAARAASARELTEGLRIITDHMTGTDHQDA